MKLIFHGHDERYAVEQSLLAFFPEERPVYDPEAAEDSAATVNLSAARIYTTATTAITYGGRTARGLSRVVIPHDLDPYEAERRRQKAVKLSFFKAARAITGVTPSWGALTGIRPGKLAERFLLEGNSPRQVDRILEKTYFVAPERRRLAIETAQAGLRAKADLRPEDISLYVGIPFCPTRCAYCSFVSQSVEKSLPMIEPYLDVLMREITDAAEMVRETGLRIKSFYMGGGTPTTLSAAQMDRLLTHLNRSFDLSGCVEYCIEAGRPDTITRDKLQVLLDHGADRISVNPQSLDDRVLAPPVVGRPGFSRHRTAPHRPGHPGGHGSGHLHGLPPREHGPDRRIAGGHAGRLPPDAGHLPHLRRRQHQRPHPGPQKGQPHPAGGAGHPQRRGRGGNAGLRQPHPPRPRLRALLSLPAEIYVRQLRERGLVHTRRRGPI